MAGKIRFHHIAALVVLVGAAAWVGTGKFASVGSEIETEHAAEAVAETAPVAEVIVRTVGAMPAAFADHAREIRLSGVTEPDKRAILAARSSGIISELNVAQGMPVEKGSVVLTLEGPDTLASVTIAEVSLDQRARELTVAEKLYAKGNLPELQLIGSRSAKAAAEANLSQAIAAADRLLLIAPFSGIVDSVDVELGEFVQAGTPIAKVLSLSPIVVKAEVSEQDIAFVQVGAKAQVTLVNGQALEGTIRYVGKDASVQTRTFPVEVELANDDFAISSGMTAELSIFTDPVRTVTVPRSVITLSDKGEVGLRVVGADDIAMFVPVKLIDDTEAGLVLTGVPEDVRIIVAGQDLVRDGDKVLVVETTAVAGSVTPKVIE
jgi:membrane fusion protein, multidrug efflux system